MQEFRRGVKRCAHVYSLAFSQDSDYLALSSNTETSERPARLGALYRLVSFSSHIPAERG